MGLSRTAVVDAAVAFVDDRGLAALTMRALGEFLHVQAMALYTWVPSREDLLDAIVERVVDELYSDPEVHLQPRAGVTDYLTRLAWGVRRIALAHPQIFPLVATRPPAAPWVRPPLRSLRWMDSFLDGLLRSGYDDEGAVAVYRGFTSFLLGHLLLEVAAKRVDLSPAADTGGPDAAGGSADASPSARTDALAGYPVLERLEERLTEDRSREEFEQSLANLLERLTPA